MNDSNYFDFAFIGAGFATIFALQRISEKSTNKKSIIIDIGRPPGKRKHQMTGFAGASIGGDGKLYTDDKELKELLGSNYKNYEDAVVSYLKDKDIISELNKSNLPSDFLNNISDYNIEEFNYYQMQPKHIHSLSKIISTQIIDDKRFQFQFDEEVIDIEYENEYYKITTQPTTQTKCDNNKVYYAKKLVLATGRTSVSWNFEVLNLFGKIKENNKIQYGIKIEIEDKICKNLNKSIFSLKENDITIGKFIWGGTMIPEDRFEYVISSVRTNESRWESKNIHFDITRKIDIDNATNEIERIANLSFIIANERVIKEPLKLVVSGKSKLSILNEYSTINGKNWIIDAIKKLENILPGLIANGKCYYPTIISSGTYKLDLDSKMSVGNDIYVIGEATGIPGLLQAAIMGNYFGDKNF